MGTSLSTEFNEVIKAVKCENIPCGDTRNSGELRKIKKLNGSFGPYFIQKPCVARGGFASVYVSCNSLGEEYCVRELRLKKPKGFYGYKTYPEDPDQEARRTTELSDVGKEVYLMRHTRCVNAPIVVFCNQKKSKLYIVQKLLNGSLTYEGNLSGRLIANDILKEYFLERGRLDIYGRFLLAELSAEVKRISDTGWGHFDVKPTNILYSDDGHLYLTDFGEVYKGTNKIPSERGTAVYRAPEQINDRYVNSHAPDVWALALSVIECLDKHPFKKSDEDLSAELFKQSDYKNWRDNFDSREFHLRSENIPQDRWFRTIFDNIKRIHEPLHDLLWRMLEIKPEQRVAIDDVVLAMQSEVLKLTTTEEPMITEAFRRLGSLDDYYKNALRELKQELVNVGELDPQLAGGNL